MSIFEIVGRNTRIEKASNSYKKSYRKLTEKFSVVAEQKQFAKIILFKPHLRILKERSICER